MSHRLNDLASRLARYAPVYLVAFGAERDASAGYAALPRASFSPVPTYEYAHAPARVFGRQAGAAVRASARLVIAV